MMDSTIEARWSQRQLEQQAVGPAQQVFLFGFGICGLGGRLESEIPAGGNLPEPKTRGLKFRKFNIPYFLYL